MIEQFWAIWDRFKTEQQKGQVIIVLIVALVVTNWYHYKTVVDWMDRADSQTIKTDELQRNIDTLIFRYNSDIAIVQKKVDDCQETRIAEHKRRIKKDSVFYNQTDKLYQKINEILTLKTRK